MCLLHVYTRQAINERSHRAKHNKRQNHLSSQHIHTSHAALPPTQSHASHPNSPQANTDSTSAQWSAAQTRPRRSSPRYTITSISTIYTSFSYTSHALRATHARKTLAPNSCFWFNAEEIGYWLIEKLPFATYFCTISCITTSLYKLVVGLVMSNEALHMVGLKKKDTSVSTVKSLCISTSLFYALLRERLMHLHHICDDFHHRASGHQFKSSFTCMCVSRDSYSSFSRSERFRNSFLCMEKLFIYSASVFLCIENGVSPKDGSYFQYCFKHMR
jgi:hypothetical protein